MQVMTDTNVHVAEDDTETGSEMVTVYVKGVAVFIYTYGDDVVIEADSDGRDVTEVVRVRIDGGEVYR